MYCVNFQTAMVVIHVVLMETVEREKETVIEIVIVKLGLFVARITVKEIHFNCLMIAVRKVKVNID